MPLFKPAKNLQAYLKVGFLGFQGSGKTYTAVELTLGLHAHIESDKPVMFLDTETGSDWAIPRFDQVGVELLVAKTRAFADLVAAFGEADGAADILIIDSVSHYWRELLESYKRSHRLSGRIPFHHWQPIKEEWQKFSDAFVNSRLHVIVCGRAGWEYDYSEDEEGNKDLIKTGTKMKAEGEFGFEPSLVVEMERKREVGTLDGKPRGTIGARVIHRAHVLKDRRMDGRGMDGAVIDNPTFGDFLPHIEALNLGGAHLGVDTSRRSDEYFDDANRSRTENRRLRTIALEEIEGTCKALWPSTSGADKQAKIAVLERLFGTKSWTAIKGQRREDVQDAARALGAFERQATSETLSDRNSMTGLLDVCIRATKEAVPPEELAALTAGRKTPVEGREGGEAAGIDEKGEGQGVPTEDETDGGHENAGASPPDRMDALRQFEAVLAEEPEATKAELARRVYSIADVRDPEMQVEEILSIVARVESEVANAGSGETGGTSGSGDETAAARETPE